MRFREISFKIRQINAMRFSLVFTEFYFGICLSNWQYYWKIYWYLNFIHFTWKSTTFGTRFVTELLRWYHNGPNRARKSANPLPNARSIIAHPRNSHAKFIEKGTIHKQYTLTRFCKVEQIRSPEYVALVLGKT